MNGRHRLAWVVVLASFFVCAAISITVPVTVSAYLQRATRPIEIAVQANQGTVGVLHGDNETGALFAGDPARQLNPRGSVLTNANDTALVLLAVPDHAQNLLARIQVYGNSNLTINEATIPRFSVSSAQPTAQMSLAGGRIMLTIPEDGLQPLDLTFEVPQGLIRIDEPGQYSFITTNADTQISVMRGEAMLQANDLTLTLNTDQRGIMTATGTLAGPVDTERNLIENSDFARSMEAWVALAASIEMQGQPTVEVGIVETAGEEALQFARVGLGHADMGLRQIVDQDVTDFESLKLLVAMRIIEQSLGVCGREGSECPLMARIEYVDGNGVPQVWQQGFYARGVVGPETPDVCVTCPPPLNEHEQVPYQQLVFYESDNLIEELGQLGIVPRHIKTLTVIASGHSFETEVVEISLLAKE
ncbi:MAG: hypothetical protein R3300_20435 [Candidatus Promineifilaceae bacterium]|nr:hypothetical protein [Candidatus Promineifilaceae bacterium]